MCIHIKDERNIALNDFKLLITLIVSLINNTNNINDIKNDIIFISPKLY